ncbi:DUF3267 domain-containing protein [Undibacterium sp. FT79W]|uniref:DUF3267 domain-containing protein n=1 Tax=Undibacterium sp. FT79W TaxID=2762296 RepID=UPI00164BC29A|nr:DUF3267 domain-containing protein [Undibacterium sp. FT79W]MBC3879402.1 DUF3267 domain-containing protein [Undibacterium sp. FT79W]
MKFTTKIPIGTTELLEDPTALIKNIDKLHVWALLFGIVIVAPGGIMFWKIIATNKDLIYVMDYPPEKFLPMLLVLMLFHEICHALAFPGFGLNDRSAMGFDRKSGLAFVSYSGVVSRRRYSVILLMPFLIITLIPYLLWIGGIEIKWAPGVSILNAIGSSGDIVILYILTKKEREKKYIQSNHIGLLKKTAPIIVNQ